MSTPSIRLGDFSTTVRASLGTQAGAVALSALHPAWAPWGLAGAAALHLHLIASGLWPRSHMLGRNWTRLPPAAARAGCVAITIDDGPDPEVTPRVLEALHARNHKATFFFIGERAARHADLVQRCAAAGHAIENHSFAHRHHFSVMGLQAQRAEIQRAQDTLTQITGTAPRFFRAPAGLRNLLLDPLLQQLGLTLASWTRRGFDTAVGDSNRVLQRLQTGLSGGDILLLHDGNAAHSSSGQAVVLEVLPRLLDTIERLGLRTTTLREAAGPA